MKQLGYQQVTVWLTAEERKELARVCALNRCSTADLIRRLLRRRDILQ